jgi:outer membrane receptor protein involved in Fe transport
VFDQGTSSFVETRQFANTETYGIEFEGVWSPVEWFDVSSTITWQDSEFKGFDFDSVNDQGELVKNSFSGNRPVRIPETALRLKPTVHLLDSRLRVFAEFQYFSDRYADAANSVELPEYHVWNVGASYNINDSLQLTFNGTNLTNELGLTEGNPRSGSFNSTDAGLSTFLARPIFGRALRASISYNF